MEIDNWDDFCRNVEEDAAIEAAHRGMTPEEAQEEFNAQMAYFSSLSFLPRREKAAHIQVWQSWVGIDEGVWIPGRTIHNFIERFAIRMH